jgi:hypothetical protein
MGGAVEQYWLNRAIRRFGKYVGVGAVLGGFCLWVAFLLAGSIYSGVTHHPLHIGRSDNRAIFVSAVVSMALAGAITWRFTWVGETGQEIRRWRQQLTGSSGANAVIGVTSGLAAGGISVVAVLGGVIMAVTYAFILPLTLAFGIFLL